MHEFKKSVNYGQARHLCLAPANVFGGLSQARPGLKNTPVDVNYEQTLKKY
jgi:hypothetical protein